MAVFGRFELLGRVIELLGRCSLFEVLGDTLGRVVEPGRVVVFCRTEELFVGLAVAGRESEFGLLFVLLGLLIVLGRTP